MIVKGLWFDYDLISMEVGDEVQLAAGGPPASASWKADEVVQPLIH